jgi:membrane protein DedA with SNARE-associated domain
MSDAARRFHLGVAGVRLGVPILSFFTIVAPLVASISRGDTDDIYWLLLVRPSKDVQLWGGGLFTTTGAVDLWTLFLAYAPLMIVMNWSFFFLGRAYGPALARGEGPGWLQRSVSPKNFATARALLARRGPAIAVIGRVAALPPTVMAAAAGTSDIGAWRYQTADTIGALVAFAVTVGVGLLLGEAYESAGPWLAVGGGALFLGLLALITRWIRNEVDVEDAPVPADD